MVTFSSSLLTEDCCRSHCSFVRSKVPVTNFAFDTVCCITPERNTLLILRAVCDVVVQHKNSYFINNAHIRTLHFQKNNLKIYIFIFLRSYIYFLNRQGVIFSIYISKYIKINKMKNRIKNRE